MTRWWRHTWTFQLAHGPLCRRQREHVVRLGRLWLCRSCLCLYATAVVTTAAVLLARPTPAQAGILGACVALPVILLSCPPVYARLPRRVRDILRAGAGALLGLALAWVVVGTWWIGLAGLAIMGGLFLAYGRARRRQRKRTCDGCPELGREQVCSGYRRQAVRIRGYEAAASAILEARLAPTLAARATSRRRGP